MVRYIFLAILLVGLFGNVASNGNKPGTNQSDTQAPSISAANSIVKSVVSSAKAHTEHEFTIDVREKKDISVKPVTVNLHKARVMREDIIEMFTTGEFKHMKVGDIIEDVYVNLKEPSGFAIGKFLHDGQGVNIDELKLAVVILKSKDKSNKKGSELNN